MADVLSYLDIVQLYKGSLLLRKGRLIKVRDVHGEYPSNIEYYDLKSRKRHVVVFVKDEYKSPINRIGYVNIRKNACYVVRTPKRVYYMGMCRYNIDVRLPEGANYNDPDYDLKDFVKVMENTAILAAHNNEYPTLDKAIVLAREWNSSCAFDKQFAVSSEGFVYYKERKVGAVVDNNLQFLDKYQYLQILLDGNHEKTSHTFRANSL